MKLFALLVNELESSVSQKEKVSALVHYLELARDEDRLWAIALIYGKRPKRIVTLSKLKVWAEEAVGLPGWLIEKSYDAVGDVPESIALLLPVVNIERREGLAYYVKSIMNHNSTTDELKKSFILTAWSSLNKEEIYILNKICTGGFRINVSQKIISMALSAVTGVDETILAHRLIGEWSPLNQDFNALFSQDIQLEQSIHPYSFCYPFSMTGNTHALGEPGEWYAERQWNGVRGQLIKRKDKVLLWSREHELIIDKFPEFNKVLDFPEADFVLDGEIVSFQEGRILPFKNIMTRLKRKKATKKTIADFPVVLIAFDILEYKNEDLRTLPFYERRAILESVAIEMEPTGVVLLSGLISFNNWEHLENERKESRAYNSKGLMIKRKDSEYGVGRKRGDWWKWKADPITINAVLVYAQRGEGGRTRSITDFTFAVRAKEGGFIPFAKTLIGVSKEELSEITNWVKKNTKERFGPVSVVNPELVFEIAFDDIEASTRHKSGVVARKPRVNKWMKGADITDVGTLDMLLHLLPNN